MTLEFRPNKKPEQIPLDYEDRRTDEQALADARKKGKIEDMDERELRLLAVANTIERSEGKRDTIGGQNLH